MDGQKIGRLYRTLLQAGAIKMLTVLVSRILNSQLFLLKNMKCKSYSNFFAKNIRVYAIFNDQSFNYTLTSDFISFEQLGPDKYFSYFSTKTYVVERNEKKETKRFG